MNGGPLPDNPYPSYTPHNSFDDQGYLKVESYEARDQVVMQTPEELERLEREQERRVRLSEYSKSLRYNQRSWETMSAVQFVLMRKATSAD